MTTLIEKSRSGTYADTSENRRKHRVGQKYGSEKKEEEKPEKTSSNEKDPAKELEAVNKVIAAINEGKLKLPQEEIMVLVEKKNNLELAKRQAEKIHSGVKANEEKRNAAEAKETSKKINEAQKEEEKPEVKSEEKEGLDEDGEPVTITHDKEKFERYRIFRDLHAARMKRGTSPNLSKMGYLKNSGDVNKKGNEKYYELQKEFGDKKYAFKEKTQEQEPKSERKTDKASDPIYQVQQKKKEASKKYDSKREEARQKYDKEADEIRSEIDKLYESDHPDAAKKRKELWNTLKEKTNKYDAETSRLKDEYEAEYKKLDEAEDKLYDQRQKEETSEEVKQSYTRVKFEDVPNSGKVNLKKYLTEKVRKGVDEKWSNIKNIPTDNLKKMEKGLVNDLNKNFEAIKKSQRAELLYSIMKVKGELEKRGKESQKKE